MRPRPWWWSSAGKSELRANYLSAIQGQCRRRRDFDADAAAVTASDGGGVASTCVTGDRGQRWALGGMACLCAVVALRAGTPWALEETASSPCASLGRSPAP